MGRTAPLTWRQYRSFIEEWTDRYLAGPEALRLAGRPVCSFLNLTDFCSCYGTTTFAIMLRYARHAIRRRCGQDPFLLGVIGQADAANLALGNALPIDGVTGYGLLPNWLGQPVQHYPDLVRQRVAEWDWLQARLHRPFLPVACAGWDASVRGEARDRLRASDGYPHTPVVTGATAGLFGSFIDHALAFNRRWHPEVNIVFLHAWNEWSECSVLEPTDRDGDALLREVRLRSVPAVSAAVPPVPATAPRRTG